MSIYVEINIHGTLEELWRKTQTPELHQRWDLRFSEIRYLPRPDESQPQRFLYATRIGAGVRIAGEGESMGQKDGEQGERTSALKFWSQDAKSLIRQGSGYWKYQPTGDAVRFFTWYDYETRFGVAGKIADRCFFRPLLGWATAWSFDRLRLWIEQGITPEESRNRSVIYSMARATVAFIWMYHGVVPKLIFHHPDEARMLTDAGVGAAAQWPLVMVAGCAEVAMGMAVLLAWRARWPLYATIVLMIAATVGVSMYSHQFLYSAFDAITLNISFMALAGIALLARNNLPSASRCLRKPKKELA